MQAAGGRPLGSGLFLLPFAQLKLLLEMLLLAFGLLQAGVLLGVDFREASQLLPQAMQFFFELVAAAALGLEGFTEASPIGASPTGAVAAGALAGFIGGGSCI